MSPLRRVLLILGLLAIPAVAYAATGGDDCCPNGACCPGPCCER